MLRLRCHLIVVVLELRYLDPRQLEFFGLVYAVCWLVHLLELEGLRQGLLADHKSRRFLAADVWSNAIIIFVAEVQAACLLVL